MASERENQALAGLLKQRGTWPSGPPAGEACPEPDLLAAYFERSLPEAERESVEAHVSLCPRCAETLATLARAGETMAPAEAAQQTRARGARWAWLDWRWLAPLGAAAAAFVLYVTVRPPDVLAPGAESARVAPAVAPHEAPQPTAAPPAVGSAARDQIASAPKPAATAPLADEASKAKDRRLTESASLDKMDKRANAAPGSIPAFRGAVGGREEVRAAASDQANQSVPPALPAMKVAPAAGPAANATLAANQAEDAQAKQQANAQAPAPARNAQNVQNPQNAMTEGKLAAQQNVPAAPAASQEGNRAVGGGLAGQQSAMSQRSAEATRRAPEPERGRAVAPAPPEQGLKKELQSNERAAEKDAAGGYAELERRRDAKSGSSVEIGSADGALLWRANAAGVIEVSKDSGATWSKQFEANAALVMAVTPEGRACWMASRSGVIVRTEDGQTWQRVSIPKGETIASLNATSALRARITTASGRVYETSDGGKSWQLR